MWQALIGVDAKSSQDLTCSETFHALITWAGLSLLEFFRRMDWIKPNLLGQPGLNLVVLLRRGRGLTRPNLWFRANFFTVLWVWFCPWFALTRTSGLALHARVVAVACANKKLQNLWVAHENACKLQLFWFCSKIFVIWFLYSGGPGFYSVHILMINSCY